MFLLIPFFPLQVLFFKLLSVLKSGPEVEKVGSLMTYLEGSFESSLQSVLQLYVIFEKFDRETSTTQWLTLISSFVLLAKTALKAAFHDNPGMVICNMLPLINCLILDIILSNIASPLPSKVSYFKFWLHHILYGIWFYSNGQNIEKSLGELIFKSAIYTMVSITL